MCVCEFVCTCICNCVYVQQVYDLMYRYVIGMSDVAPPAGHQRRGGGQGGGAAGHLLALLCGGPHHRVCQDQAARAPAEDPLWPRAAAARGGAARQHDPGGPGCPRDTCHNHALRSLGRTSLSSIPSRGETGTCMPLKLEHETLDSTMRNDSVCNPQAQCSLRCLSGRRRCCDIGGEEGHGF